METQFTKGPGNDYREGIIAAAAIPDQSAVAWCAVFAGAVASAALSLILLLLGTGFGLTLISPWANEGISGTSFGVTSIVGIILISILASAMGGYIAGRLRTRWNNTATDEVYFRDTAHGFLSWAVATLTTAALLTTVIASIISGGVKAGAEVVGGAAAAAGEIATAAAASSDSNDKSGMDNNPLSYLLDSLVRKDAYTPQPYAAQPEPVPANPLDNAETTTQPVIAPPKPAPMHVEPETKAEIARIFMHAISTGDLPQEDAKYAGQLVAQATGIDQPTAEKRVTDAFATLQTKMQEAETAAREAADKARKVSAHTSLWMFISLLCGAFIASLMAVYGGRQRDLY